MPKPYKKGGATKAVKHSQPCRYYQRGKCNNPNCPYLHVKEKGAAANILTTSSATGASPAAEVILTVLKLFFEKHQYEIFNAEARMLNLNALASQEELVGIASSINFNNRNFCEALCQCVTTCISPPPSILALEQNDISSVYHLSHAMEESGMHKTLQALSLAQNSIKSCDFAKELKNFTGLVELNMLGNPAADLMDYKQKVKKFLPFLTLLDTTPLSAAPLALPWPLYYDVSEAQAGLAPQPIPSGGRALAYDSVQKSILQFVQNAVLNPLEQEPGTVPHGTVTGVDAVSEAYSLNACLSISLSCPEAAVTTPQQPSGGSANGGAGFRNMVREIVGFRIRQTESDHNLIKGGGKGSATSAKAAQVAIGRTQVCAQLEHWLYPKSFSVGHYIHASPDVAVLDNNGMGPHAPAQFKEPVSVVTLHGVMVWRFRPDGPRGTTGNGTNATGTGVFGAPVDRGLVLIKRNFSRVLTVAVAGAEGERWHIMNDMITLYPFVGTVTEEDGDAATAAAVLQTSPSGSATGSGGEGQLSGTGLSLAGGMFDDLNPYDVVFSPASDPNRAAAMARRFQVPIPVVAVVTKSVSSDAELAHVLSDIQGVPLDAFEQCATLAGGDALAGVFLCRLHKQYGVDPHTTGVQVLKQCGLNWAAVQAALQQSQ